VRIDGREAGTRTAPRAREGRAPRSWLREVQGDSRPPVTAARRRPQEARGTEMVGSPESRTQARTARAPGPPPAGREEPGWREVESRARAAPAWLAEARAAWPRSAAAAARTAPAWVAEARAAWPRSAAGARADAAQEQGARLAAWVGWRCGPAASRAGRAAAPAPRGAAPRSGVPGSAGGLGKSPARARQGFPLSRPRVGQQTPRAGGRGLAGEDAATNG
jgi:hypothetical protein